MDEQQPIMQSHTTSPAPEEMEKMKKERDEYLAGWKRARADYENLLKETVRERERMGAVMTEAAVAAFLPVFDHLKRAIQTPPTVPPLVRGGKSEGSAPLPNKEGLGEVEGNYIRQWIDGVRHIFAEFEDVLHQFAVSEIVAVGQKFDPAQHESMGTETDQEKDDGVVLREIEGGYALGGRVVRPARVIVNKRE